MIHFFLQPIAQLIIWIHLAINPMQVIQIDTQNTATILETLKQSHEVETGFVCQGIHDIQCIDGICNNPDRKLYWTIEVNGNYKEVNSNTITKPNDKILLKYGRNGK